MSQVVRDLPPPARDTGSRVSPLRVLDGLRERVRAIEGHGAQLEPWTQRCLGEGDTMAMGSGSSWAEGDVDRSWTLGVGQVDEVLPGGVLDAGGVHEIRSRGAGDNSAAVTFALRLAVRRLRGLEARGRQAPRRPPVVLWCGSRREAAEQGRPYGPGLAELGLGSTSSFGSGDGGSGGRGSAGFGGLLVVEARGGRDVLWAMEEGLRAGSVALVVGTVDRVDSTAARRLALAAAAGGTPALVLPRWDAPATLATATRWRVAPLASASHPLVAANPGAARLSLVLERCRHGASGSEGLEVDVEWSDVAHRFCLASRVAIGAIGAGGARQRAG